MKDPELMGLAEKPERHRLTVPLPEGSDLPPE